MTSICGRWDVTVDFKSSGRIKGGATPGLHKRIQMTLTSVVLASHLCLAFHGIPQTQMIQSRLLTKADFVWPKKTHRQETFPLIWRWGSITIMHLHRHPLNTMQSHYLKACYAEFVSGCFFKQTGQSCSKSFWRKTCLLIAEFKFQVVKYPRFGLHQYLTTREWDSTIVDLSPVL